MRPNARNNLTNEHKDFTKFWLTKARFERYEDGEYSPASIGMYDRRYAAFISYQAGLKTAEHVLAEAVSLLEGFVPDPKTIQWTQRELDAKSFLERIRGGMVNPMNIGTHKGH
jgi:hypothetical protein